MARAIGLVQLGQALALLLRQISQPRALLLLLGVNGQRAGAHGAGRQLGVATEKAQGLLTRAAMHGGQHGLVQCVQAGKGALLRCSLGHPGGVFKNLAERGRKVCVRHDVELVERGDGGGSGASHEASVGSAFPASQCWLVIARIAAGYVDAVSTCEA